MEEAIRQALEHRVRAADGEPRKQRDNSPTAIAARKARIDAAAEDIARMPVLDPRSAREIMDDLNVP